MPLNNLNMLGIFKQSTICPTTGPLNACPCCQPNCRMRSACHHHEALNLQQERLLKQTLVQRNWSCEAEQFTDEIPRALHRHLIEAIFFFTCCISNGIQEVITISTLQIVRMNFLDSFKKWNIHYVNVHVKWICIVYVYICICIHYIYIYINNNNNNNNNNNIYYMSIHIYICLYYMWCSRIQSNHVWHLTPGLGLTALVRQGLLFHIWPKKACLAQAPETCLFQGACATWEESISVLAFKWQSWCYNLNRKQLQNVAK